MARGNGEPPIKLYYRIGEVAGLVGVEPHVLRYWESEFPTIRPQKSRSGQRVYSRRDVEKLLRVKELLYEQRFTIAGARQRLRTVAADAIDAGPRDDHNVWGETAGSGDTQSRVGTPSEAQSKLQGEGARQPCDTTQLEMGARVLDGRGASHGADSQREDDAPSHGVMEDAGNEMLVAAMTLRNALLAVRSEVVRVLETLQRNESDP